jgi:hypothetical protein
MKLNICLRILGFLCIGSMVPVVCFADTTSSDAPKTGDVSPASDWLGPVEAAGTLLSDIYSGSISAITVSANPFSSLFDASETPLIRRPNLNYQPYSKGYRLSPYWTLTPVSNYFRINDNNVYRSESGRKKDNINRVQTGFSTNMFLDQERRYGVALSYTALLEYFDRYSREDHDDHFIGASTSLRFDRFTIKGSGKWSRTASRDSINLPDSENVSEQADLKGVVEVPLGDLFAEGEVRNYHVDHLNPKNDPFGRNELWGIGRLGLNLSKVDQAYFEYGHLNVTYSESEDRDAEAHQFGIGLRWYPSTTWSIQALGGYQQRVYELDIKPDYYGFVGELLLQKKFGDQHGLTVILDSRPGETTYLGMSLATRHRLNYDYRMPLGLKGLYLLKRGGVGYDEYGQISSAGGDSETRRDYVWSESVGGEYFIPNTPMSVYANYSYTAIDSNTAGLDIDTQQVIFGLKSYF